MVGQLDCILLVNVSLDGQNFVETLFHFLSQLGRIF